MGLSHELYSDGSGELMTPMGAVNVPMDIANTLYISKIERG